MHIITTALITVLVAHSTASRTLGESAAPLRLVLAGDSTVCDYPALRPDRGWGQFLAEHFQPGTVTVINRAAGGRSTKTFIKEGRWQNALAEKPDYMFIQFGHNDSHAPENPESTAAAGDFRDYLRRYIDETHSAGATPILITPMVRRIFDGDGNLQDSLAPYADAMKAVAREKSCAIIDLHASSLSLVEELGPGRARSLANKPDDFTHFNEKGARAMADLIVRDLPGAEPKLGKLVVTASIHAATDGIRQEEITVKAPFEMPVIKVPAFPQRDFIITDFGAKPGGETKNTEAIRTAVAACHDAGGGRVVIPAGEWLTGAVHLMSNVNLHIAKNAVLKFSDDPQDYLPAVQSSWEGWECFNYSPLVYAFQCENVAITGEGKLEAKIGTWTKWSSRPPAHMEALKWLYNTASKGASVEERQMAMGENNLRPQFIQFNRCRNVLMEDVKIRNSPFWCVHLLLCDSVVIRRIDVSAHGHNNDGIDPEGTRNLLVEDCRFDQGDDAIAIKSGTNHDGWRLNTPSENIVIRNCNVIMGHQLVAIGSELSGGIRNVYVHDCRFDARSGPYNLLYIKTNRQRGGFVEDITMENIEATSTRFGVLGIETDVLYQWRNLVPAYEERLTRIRGVTVRNVKVGKSATPFRILGDKDQPVCDVLLENIGIDTVHGRKNRYENTQNVVEKNIRIRTFIDEPDKVSKGR